MLRFSSLTPLTLAPSRGWLLKDTTGASDDEVLRILAATNAKDANVNASNVNTDVAVNIINELAEDVFAAESLETFLTVVIPEGGESTVMVVSRLSRYCPEPGVVFPWTGQGFGFPSEAEEGSCPRWSRCQIGCRCGRHWHRRKCWRQRGRSGTHILLLTLAKSESVARS
jgi:hypothetical protein